MISSLVDLFHFINHITNILRVSLPPIHFRNVNYPLSNVKGQVSVAGHELQARHSFRLVLDFYLPHLFGDD